MQHLLRCGSGQNMRKRKTGCNCNNRMTPEQPKNMLMIHVLGHFTRAFAWADQYWKTVNELVTFTENNSRTCLNTLQSKLQRYKQQLQQTCWVPFKYYVCCALMFASSHTDSADEVAWKRCILKEIVCSDKKIWPMSGRQGFFKQEGLKVSTISCDYKQLGQSFRLLWPLFACISVSHLN